jgi:hypothetical protein
MQNEWRKMKKMLAAAGLVLLLLSSCQPVLNTIVAGEPLMDSHPTLMKASVYPDSLLTDPEMDLAVNSESVPIHALRIDYPDLAASRDLVDDLEIRARNAGINMIALGAGRVEWVYFKWLGHENVWANDVKDTEIDYLMEDARRFEKWAHVNAVVDLFAPNYIKAHPDQAAISYLGVPSQYLVGTMDLVDGEFGQMVLDMIEAISANYPVDSISITELFYHSDGYGSKEKTAYLAYSGRDDWPRTSDGHIDINDRSIGDWRGYELDRYLDRAVQIAHKHGKQMFMDVALSLDNLAKMTNEHGTNYNLVLEHMDKLVIWAYLDLDDYPPEDLFDIGLFLTQFDTQRIILSIGLWSSQNPVISPDKLNRAIIAAKNGYMPNIWITPSSLVQAGHWTVLEQLWGKPFANYIPGVTK